MRRRSPWAPKVLQWAREHDCPWDAWTCEAAEFGHLDVLRWARGSTSVRGMRQPVSAPL